MTNKDNRIKMTRADKLRSMTDEQLVDFIFEYGIDERLNFCRVLPEREDGCASDEDCKKCLMEWLKEECRMGKPSVDKENEMLTKCIQEPEWKQRVMNTFLGGR